MYRNFNIRSKQSRVFFAYSFKKTSAHGDCGVDYDDVAEELADKRPEDDSPDVSSQDAEGDGDGCAENGEERECGYPRTSLLDVVAGLAQTTFLDVHPMGNLLYAADAPDEVVKHGTKHVADGACDNGKEGVHASGDKEGSHHGFGAEGNKGAGKEGGHSHAEIAVLYEKLIEGIQGS